MINFKSENIGNVVELGEIVKCAVCGENGVQLGIVQKGKKVRFIHSFNWFKKGSRKKRIYDEICVMDGLQMLEVKANPKKSRFKKAKK